ncbi:MAG: hypothetical protein A3B68_05670 [Candidatus Melainabacteria bacterium RIFCSPHIGHO2_02_FULL_34_12]|nr:MAG: hypothetical protein A3B68_05670 [Candidatus Melainabacteria bacterium RIFCSPHIGHO2_02_FULL_34_12]
MKTKHSLAYRLKILSLSLFLLFSTSVQSSFASNCGSSNRSCVGTGMSGDSCSCTCPSNGMSYTGVCGGAAGICSLSFTCPTPTPSPRPSPQPDGCENNGCNWSPLTSSQHACTAGQYCRASSLDPTGKTCYCSDCANVACGSDGTNCYDIPGSTGCNTSAIPCFCITPTPTPTPTPDCSNTSFASACYGRPGGGGQPNADGSCPAGQEPETFTYATGSSTCCCPTPTPTPTPSPSPTPTPTPTPSPTPIPPACASLPGGSCSLGACPQGQYCDSGYLYGCNCYTSPPSPTPAPTPTPSPSGTCGGGTAPNCSAGSCSDPEVCQVLTGILGDYCGCGASCTNSFPTCGGGCRAGSHCGPNTGGCTCYPDTVSTEPSPDGTIYAREEEDTSDKKCGECKPPDCNGKCENPEKECVTKFSKKKNKDICKCRKKDASEEEDDEDEN